MDFFKPPIVLIHGLWMTPLSWEYWIPYFQKEGFEVHAPGWPGVDGRTHEEICADPKPISLHRIEDIVDHYETYIKKLAEPPIIIGHSFGGLFAQILLSRGLGALGIAVCPAQPAGIIYISPSTIRTAMPIFTHPLHSDATVPISESHFHYCFGNLVTAEESKKLWERYCIPADSRVLWQLATNVTAGEAAPHYVQFDKPDRAPLLLIGASKDHIVTARTVRKEFKAYKGRAPVKYKEFGGMSHGLIFQEGWETVANYVLEYINKHIH
ncbi:arylesterase [Colletotrichum cuscutae]|uniref:Arylesterase n=3 Tax=Colletotrichum acutatum species complex TaxID=2707335 RepID=A0A9P9XQP0_9PEZI|nr:arylesterase [Colletotrichum abscissum]KAK1450631.1 arylesterase [Colletotrichum cuscutae]